MIVDVLILLSLATMLIILAAILGAIHRPERFAFVAGIFLFIVGHALFQTPEALGLALAVVGIILAGASTVPMLREPV